MIWRHNRIFFVDQLLSESVAHERHHDERAVEFEPEIFERIELISEGEEAHDNFSDEEGPKYNLSDLDKTRGFREVISRVQIRVHSDPNRIACNHDVSYDRELVGSDNLRQVTIGVEVADIVPGLFMWTYYDSRGWGVGFSAFLPTQFMKNSAN